MTVSCLSDFLVHLRVRFILFLVPIYLFGVVVGEGNLFTATALIDFVIIHVFFYGGVNALNDYYDRDERGPIGGLERPPPVHGDSLFYLAWLWKLIGLSLAVQYASSIRLPLAGVLCILTSVAYSHPRIRLKGNPLASTLLVMWMQGFLAFYMGTLVESDNPRQQPVLKFWMGAVAISLLLLGLYPLSQVYQIEQDRSQGDRTLALYLGVERTFRLSGHCLLVSGLLNGLLMGCYYRWWQGGLVVLNALALTYGVRMWEKRFERQTVMENFRSLHRLMTLQTGCLYAFCFGHLLHVL